MKNLFSKIIELQKLESLKDELIEMLYDLEDTIQEVEDKIEDASNDLLNEAREIKVVKQNTPTSSNTLENIVTDFDIVIKYLNV